jgi:hypothetical protein
MNETEFKEAFASRLRRLLDDRLPDATMEERARQLDFPKRTLENYVRENGEAQIPTGTIYRHRTRTRVDLRRSDVNRWSDVKIDAVARIIEAGGGTRKPPKRVEPDLDRDGPPPAVAVGSRREG